jgi:crotonobetaine/carnitine-CoA ligase
MMDVIQLAPRDTTYLPFALYHILGQVHVIGALRNGGKIALAEKFSVSQFWNDVRQYEATVLVHQGASIPLLLKQQPSELDRKHNVRLSVGAGVQSEEVWKAFEKRFGVKILEHYAQTEGAFFGAGTMPTNRAGTIGLPYSSAEIRIVDESDVDVNRGVSGQLISRLKPENAKKTPEKLYYKDVAKGFSRFTKDGFFRSGDVVQMDDQGYLHYVGKVETFIRYRGENISPLQIESVLSRHPQVEECIAVGVPNQEFGGDDIKVVVATKQDASLAPSELITWCESNFPKFMIPRYVEFVLELKKTEQTKKVVRNEYRENSANTWDRFR